MNRWQQKMQVNRWYFDCHADVAVQRGAHRPMEHIQGFTRSHWMPPLGECLHHIVPAAAMVDKFVENTQNTNKIQLLPSNYGTFWSLVVCENLNPETNLYSAHWWNKLRSNVRQHNWSWRAQRSATFLAIKRCQRTKIVKVIKLAWSSLKSWAQICARRSKAVNSLTA